MGKYTPRPVKSNQSKLNPLDSDEGILLQWQDVVRIKISRDAKSMQVTRQRRNETPVMHHGHIHNSESHIQLYKTTSEKSLQLYQVEGDQHIQERATHAASNKTLRS